MSMICPQCKQVYEQSGVCPLCNVFLLYNAENLLQETPSANEMPAAHQDLGEPPQWQQTPWGKILVGLILAQGLNFGLQQLLTAGFLVSGDSSDVWQTLWGLVLHHAILAISLFIGGALTGAGQSRGIIYGAIVGLASGTISILLQDRSQPAFSSILTYAAPAIHLATGALGGGLGMLIWRPLPQLPVPKAASSTPVTEDAISFPIGNILTGPIHIGRICIGAFLLVVGVVWSKAILDFLLRAGSGTFTISSQLQAQLVSMEISALAVLLGAGFAGATTSNGLKQGLCVGLGAGVIILGIQLGNPKYTLESILITIAGIVIVSLVGGWFGGQLFPPFEPGRRRRSPY